MDVHIHIHSLNIHSFCIESPEQKTVPRCGSMGEALAKALLQDAGSEALPEMDGLMVQNGDTHANSPQ